MGEAQVFLDHGFYVTRWDGVQIKDVSDLDLHWLGKRIVRINFAHNTSGLAFLKP